MQVVKARAFTVYIISKFEYLSTGPKNIYLAIEDVLYKLPKLNNKLKQASKHIDTLKKSKVNDMSFNLELLANSFRLELLVINVFNFVSNSPHHL
ncbi:hypothetical protein [Clostridium sp. CCUG 7971]|uniref:hypothetical protein n=1 Tax=Clostridium sp. CCUG 7971 TaxID=2811414 RepID=UPI0025706A3D|nr:hypothetical protein [Clostridium sp. CCUG 7971]